MTKLRIVFFIDNLQENLDGVSNTSHRIIERLEGENIQPLIFTSIPPKSSGFKYPYFKVPSITIPYSPEYQLAFYGKKKEIFEQIDLFQPHLIHWSTPTLLGKYALEYSRSRKIPNLTVYHAHWPSYIGYFKFMPFKAILNRRLENFFRKYYNSADLVLAPTDQMKRYLENINVDEGRIRVWGRGIDREKFNINYRSSDFLRKYGVEPGDKVILFVSRLVNYKGVDILIKLSNILPGKTKLVITGEGPETANLKEKCKKGTTIFTGRLVGKDLSKLYASGDLFIFPSKTDTFGNVVLEAMSSGLPVIAADYGGPKSIIKHGETGFLVEEQDEHEYYQCIDELFSNEKLYQSMRENAIEYTKTITWEVLVEDLFSIYRELIETNVSL